MNPLATLLGATAIAVATSAWSEPIDIASVQVQADLEAVDGGALDYWPELETDIATEIARQVSGQAGDDGYAVEVVLSEVSLDGSPRLTEDGAFNRLQGRVIVYPQEGGAPLSNFPVDLVAYEDQSIPVPAGAVVIPPTRGDFYNALVGAFAGLTAERLAGLEAGAAPTGFSEDNEAADAATPDAAEQTDETGSDGDGTDGSDGADTGGTDDAGSGDAGSEESGSDDSGSDDSGSDNGGADDSGSDDGGSGNGGSDDGGSEDSTGG